MGVVLGEGLIPGGILQQLIGFAESVVFGAVWKINKFPGADRIHVEKCVEGDEEEDDS